MKQLLREIIKAQNGFVEIRYQKKTNQSLFAENGKIESSAIARKTGIGIRVLENGSWGFSSTGTLTKDAIYKAIDRARKSAVYSAKGRSEKISISGNIQLAKGDFILDGVSEIESLQIDSKIDLVLNAEKTAKNLSNQLQTASSRYSEILEEKHVLTTDGADAYTKLVRPEFSVSATATKNGNMLQARESIGVTGGWDCLFQENSFQKLAESAVSNAVHLLDSGFPDGGMHTVILSPSIVGLLIHEAIGHTVEADFVLSGSVASGKLGQRVGSELVNLSDSGSSEFFTGAGGTFPVDDEGVFTQNTQIIKDGILKSYLHNRETANIFGVEPTGSARAWDFSDVPLIRMRNTYLHPGESSLEEMIANTKEGYFLEGALNGQADATGEFMFATLKARKIENGKLTKLCRGVSVSGLAFDVLANIDMVSKEFKWDLGSGYCGKGQPAKVDAGGPYVRTKVLLGGVS